MRTFEQFKNNKDINHRDSDGSTPLINAVITNNLKKVKKLILQGANINIQDDAGYTALMWAILEYNEGQQKGIYDKSDHQIYLEILKEILKAKPDLSIKDEENMSFWDLSGTKTREYMLSVAGEDIQLYLDTEKYNL
jgi:ankyrin repeat protein